MSRRRRRGTRTAGVAAGVVVVAGAAAAATFGLGGGNETPAKASTTPPATATVTRQNLADQESQNGTLGHGTTVTVPNKLPGTITAVADTGAVVNRGEALYRVDNTPVVLLYGALPAYRALAPGVEGADVKQFEQQLHDLGYTGFTVDEEYNAATATAVKKWQKKLGLTQTGSIELGRVVYYGGPVRVESQTLTAGATAAPGGTVLTISGTDRVVTVKLAVDDRRLAQPGAKVQVELPDSTTVDGTISKVATVVDTSGQSSTTKVEVTVALAKAPEGLDDATVNVKFTAEERKNVLTVPVAALLALAEGGYGVQVVHDGQTHLVAVKTGLFSGGRVEVSGAGITEGLTVGMPS
jgi:membrane fusion protein, multidrug efflux system